MKTYKNLFALTLVLLLSACASAPSFKFPVPEATVALHYSKDTVSTWTETAAGDSFLPDSQVAVAKSGMGASAFGGLIGVAIDRSGAKSRAADTKDEMTQYFDQILRSNINAKTISAKFLVSEVADESQADFTLLPWVRFETNKQGVSLLDVRLTARYLGGSKPQTKNYFYISSANNLPLKAEQGATWFGRKGVFESTKETGFANLAQVFLDDLQGTLPSPDSSTLTEISWVLPWANNAIMSGLLLTRYDAATAVAPKFGNRVFPNTIFLLDNTLLLSNQ